MNIIEKIYFRLKYYYWSPKFMDSKGPIVIGYGTIFRHPELMSFGKNIVIGNNSKFLPVIEYAGYRYSPKIIIGDRCGIGIRNSFACINSIEIGDDVLFAGNVHITDHSHGYEDIDTPIVKQKLISKGGVKIGNQCWLGFSCEILSGVTIGQHSIVAARSVVTKDVPPYCIVAGNPARIIKKYNKLTGKWERV